MTTLTVRNIDPVIKDKLRMAAAANGRSMEEEVRSILRTVLTKAPSPKGLGSRIQARFQAVGGIDLDLPERTDGNRWADFESQGKT
jgi:antitoxin FitA